MSTLLQFAHQKKEILERKILEKVLESVKEVPFFNHLESNALAVIWDDLKQFIIYTHYVINNHK